MAVYMYTFYKDLHCSAKSLTEIMQEQGKRDNQIVDRVPRFPMARDDFNLYADLIKRISMENDLLYMLFVDSEDLDCMVLKKGTCSFYESKVAALRAIMKAV